MGKGYGGFGRSRHAVVCMHCMVFLTFCLPGVVLSFSSLCASYIFCNTERATGCLIYSLKTKNDDSSHGQDPIQEESLHFRYGRFIYTVPGKDLHVPMGELLFYFLS